MSSQDRAPNERRISNRRPTPAHITLVDGSDLHTDVSLSLGGVFVYGTALPARLQNSLVGVEVNLGTFGVFSAVAHFDGAPKERPESGVFLGWRTVDANDAAILRRYLDAAE